MVSIDGHELRQNRRISTDMLIRYCVVDGQGDLAKHQRTKTTNVSADGVAFISSLAIPIDSRIEVEITVPGGVGILKGEARLVRIVRELPEGRGIEYGLQFDSDTIEDKELLAKFVSSVDIVPILRAMTKQGASDLHLLADNVPIFRIRRQLVAHGKQPIPDDVLRAMIYGTLSAERREKFQRDKELYFPFMVPGLGRWRGSVFYQRGKVEATFHAIDLYVPTITELGLPGVVHNLAMGDGGLIIVNGGSKSGKSTTIAAMIRAINHEKRKVIVTLEDPIQFIHQNEQSIIKQREVGSDTKSIAEGMKHIMRQDPDVILIDEINDCETMDMALRAAETGHLVLTSFPTVDAASTIKNILGLYPGERRAPTLHTLSTVLRGIISQRLLPSLDGSEFVMVHEILTMSDSIRQAIWTNKLEQIFNLMISSPGSITLDNSLRNVILRGQVDFDRAAQIARDPDGLRRTVAI